MVRFGLFDWIDRNGGAVADIYEERLRLARAADAAGFTGYHLAEHHFTYLGTAPSPSLFLAAMARETTRLRLGALVYLLPLYEPLRLIEEICILDHLSRGRLDVGVGRGISPFELNLWNIDPEDSRPLFEEALDVLVKGLTSDKLTHEGEHYQYHGVPMALRPYQQPYPPLWCPTSNPASATRIAQRGMHIMGLGRASGMTEAFATYRTEWQKHRDEPSSLNPTVTEPITGLNRQIFVAETDAEALAIARPAYAHFSENFFSLADGSRRGNNPGSRDLDVVMDAGAVLIGSPARVREQIASQIADCGANYFTLAFAWGSLTIEQSLRSLHLFASEVAPAFSEAGVAV